MSDSLGAWEDRPQRNFDADVTAVDLDNREAFVLTRIDGVVNIAELCAMSGFEQADTLQALERLLETGLIAIEPADGARRLIAQSRPRLGTRRTPKPRLANDDHRPDLPPFHGVEPQIAAWLESRGPIGHVPGRPYAEPGRGRYGTFSFDRHELLARCDLSIDQKREIVFLSSTLGELDHFEFFGIDPTDDRKALKKAYFLFSRKFHPDTFFRKEVGPFRARLEKIFKHGTDVHDALATDEPLRTRYAYAVQARNEAYRNLLERDREAREKILRAQKLRNAARRKEELRDRLMANTKQRRATGASNPVAERLQKAERFYEQGMKQYQDEKFLAAASSLQLAMTYDPKNETYQQAYERVAEKAAQVRAEMAWKRGYMEESIGRTPEAIQSYLEAVEIYPRPDYCAHVAEVMITFGEDPHTAARLARMASDADPQNVDYLLLLGRIYAEVNLPRKAVAVLEKALQLDPKNDEAKKALRAAKRM
ncbi:MAG: tetratricopeptide repeat protein [Myxococcales bacterium]|nr:tetratricopeptide repeat protein [Myxococcales bacterium]MCB9538961.1 tetratricopeptide repeat protein [Myxococcales bacterium]